MDEFDKADWNTFNTTAFCKICVEEIRAGNRPIGVMTTRGYKNIAEKYLLITRLRHSRTQLKNRWDALKGLYSFWLRLNKDTGLGWDNTKGTVTASDTYWKENTKNHSEWRKLKNGPPECLDELQIMFDLTAVDGSSSCVPGEGIGEEIGEGGGEENGREESNSKGSNPLKRCSSSNHGTSPKKKVKNPMVKIMKGIWETMQANSAVVNKVMQGEKRFESIKEVMSLAVECGATEGSVEHFMASQLFVKAENHDMNMYGSDDEDEAFEVARNQLDVLEQYGAIFCTFGKFYLVDSGYPNRTGFLAPYKGTKYHLPEFRQGPRPSGKKEAFNYLHSSLRNVIERSFGVLKMKWRILLDLPSYHMLKQTRIIHACMTLHNFIRDSAMSDADFDMCDQDENYMPIPSQGSGENSELGDEEGDMNVLRDSIANALYAMRE
ncbi:uncharacterized protein LOC133914769 [Phragmites australis]|uniref:uncharacterized protein LOC133914769 n=1 Tax=Phragmites australis TaxID=29695 RepID=UPI002D777199|nr:uncharacterized protein LOC133914769 [Phragmites australis]